MNSALSDLARIAAIVLLLWTCPLAAQRPAPSNLTEAMAVIDNLPATPEEGIWEYPEDGVKVIILRNPHENHRFDISVVQSDDVRLKPGMRMGTLRSSVEKGKYRLSLCSNVKNGKAAGMRDCLARLSENGEALIIERPSVRFRITPSMVIPLFWSRVRLNVRLNVDDPVSRLHEGMRKIYPSQDGNGLRRNQPRYL